MLEQSMLSSFDTDLGPEESLAYSDALLKTFQTRYSQDHNVLLLSLSGTGRSW